MSQCTKDWPPCFETSMKIPVPRSIGPCCSLQTHQQHGEIRHATCTMLISIKKIQSCFGLHPEEESLASPHLCLIAKAYAKLRLPVGLNTYKIEEESPQAQIHGLFRMTDTMQLKQDYNIILFKQNFIQTVKKV